MDQLGRPPVPGTNMGRMWSFGRGGGGCSWDAVDNGSPLAVLCSSPGEVVGRDGRWLVRTPPQGEPVLVPDILLDPGQNLGTMQGISIVQGYSLCGRTSGTRRCMLVPPTPVSGYQRDEEWQAGSASFS